MEDVAKNRRRGKIEDYIGARTKSPAAGITYALILGPFGCFYTNPRYALVGILLAVGLGIIYWPLISLVWLGCAILAPFQVRAYNARVRRGARYDVV